MHDNVLKLNDNLAAEMRDSYVDTIESFNDQLTTTLKKGFAMENDEVYEFLQDSESKIYEYAISELKTVFR